MEGRICKSRRGEKGITGLETAIILIAFVVVASVFSYVVLSAGFLATDQAKGAIQGGLDKTQATLEIRGGVIGNDTDDDGDIDNIEFVVACAISGQSVDVSALTTTVTYYDTNEMLYLPYDITEVYNPVGVVVYPPATTWGKKLLIDEGATDVLDAQDQMSICIDISTLVAPLENNSTFTIEVKPPAGGVLIIERTTPGAIYTVTDLH